MMKKIAILILLLNTLLAENGIIANIGAGAGYYRYAEPSLMDDNALSINVNTQAGYRLNMLKIIGELDLFGTVGFYSGSELNLGGDGNYDEKQKTTDDDVATLMTAIFFDSQAKLGFDMLFFNNNMDLFLQSGIGFRQLESMLAYRRTQVYVYVPIELEGTIKRNANSNWTYMLGYRHIIDSRHRTLIKAAGVTVEGDYFTKQKGFGAKAGFGWSTKEKNKTTFTRFVLDYWNIKKGEEMPSTTTTGGRGSVVEPKNYTLSVYVQYGWNF